MNTNALGTEPRTRTADSTTERAVEARLKKMLQEGLCDLYDVVAVLQGLDRLPMDVPENPKELQALLKA